jgi:hypothetical protein
VLKSALDYREYNLGVYGIELPMLGPWTSKPAVIDIVLGLFDNTTRFVESSESGGDQNLLAQLPELASILFACIQERLDWLERRVFDVLDVDQVTNNERLVRLPLMILVLSGTERSLTTGSHNFAPRFLRQCVSEPSIAITLCLVGVF